MTIGLTQEDINLLLKRKLMWSHIGEIVDQINSHAWFYLNDIQSTTAASKRYDSFYMKQNLQNLCLLRIPFHYDGEGKIYVNRSEIEHRLYPAEAEQLLQKARKIYNKLSEIDESVVLEERNETEAEKKFIRKLLHRREEIIQQLKEMGFETYYWSDWCLSFKDDDHGHFLFHKQQELEENDIFFRMGKYKKEK